MRNAPAFVRMAGSAAETVFEALDMGSVNPFFLTTMSLEVAEGLRRAGEKNDALDALARAIDAAAAEVSAPFESSDSPLWDRAADRLNPAQAGEPWVEHKNRQAKDAAALMRRAVSERALSPEWRSFAGDDARYGDIVDTAARLSNEGSC